MHAASEVTFNQLTYDQFLAGEFSTINRTDSHREKEGRIRLLERITHWKLRQGVAWSQLRSTYVVILRDIENRIISWSADFNQYYHHVIERPILMSSNTRIGKDKDQKPIIRFCKNYQIVDGCAKESPHVARIDNHDKIVHHVCARCWLKERTKRAHPETSPDCPLSEH